MTKVQRYSLTLDNDIVSISPVDMRPEKIMTSVTELGQAIIDGIYIGGQNQLIGELDAYFLSTSLASKLRTEFLTEHGLLGKSYQEIDNYLDDNELSMPDTMRLDLPVIRKDTEVKLTGKFNVNCFTSIMGMARID